MPIDEREQDNRTLRTLIITALTETGQTRDTLYAKIGEFYYCAAPKYLYKYYSENPLNMDAIKNHEMWYSAPCNFNDVFDCDVSINGFVLPCIKSIKASSLFLTMYPFLYKKVFFLGV